ncbi:MAG TPA: DEAD/DEAH box helicase [Vicinamibacteria bacterium]|nr:DEAD/DEAH box helicase [Vicinamibacteria bacterium]
MTTGLPQGFRPAVRAWFAETFPGPTRVQSLGFAGILAGRSALLFAPTGSGKTLAAFLCAIDRLMFEQVPAPRARCRVVYVSPLRALAVDIERNLRTPLAGIARVAERRGEAFHAPSVFVRTGDTPAAERARALRAPPDVLITTPESLFLVLTSNARDMLASVEAVIVDEIHVMVGTKRGAHLALSLERLEELARGRIQRIGLSATQRPLEEVARFLGGGRKVAIVDAGAKKAFELTVEVPVEDMSRLGEPLAGEELPGDEAGVPRRSIWPRIHPRLLELIRAHRSTILFVNSRRLAERLAGALNELAGEPLVRAHHGSIAREERLAIEDALKAGRLPAMVATSSLELGIDMGAVDLVIQIETPPSVASGMQRIGRAGHRAGLASRGVIFPKYRGDLLATAAITQAMDKGAVEATRIPQNPLDVLAQQLVGAVAMGERRVDDLYALVRRAAPFAKLPRAQFEGVLDMLSGRYPSDAFAELRPRLTWDRLRGVVRPREGVRRLVVANAGTIPDRGLFGVFLADGGDGRRGGRRVGELDEEMVFESREGDVFVLGATSWRIAEITREAVYVTPAPAMPGRMPFWKGDRVARPLELGLAIGRLTRELLHADRDKARARLVRDHALEAQAADNLLAYLADQKQATGAVPDDRTLVLERTRDEIGDWRLLLLSPLGGRVHAPLALAIESKLERAGEPEVETQWSDDGIVIRLPDRERPPDLAALLPASTEAEALVAGTLGGTALFAAHFREAAARALLLPRRRPGQRAPLWMQRKRAHDLLQVAAQYSSFPIVLEAYRECLQDVFDVPALVERLRLVERREIRLVTVDTEAPSPFASALLFGYVANYMYEGDAPLAERRAMALAVDQRQLRELLGEAELRELLDPAALSELELFLQGLAPASLARNADRLHDLLLRVGDLSDAEVAARCDPPAAAGDWVRALEAERRACRVLVAGEERLVALEDIGKLRDALGIAPPLGVPQAFLEPVEDALGAVMARYARTHGPFAALEAARRYGVGEGMAGAALQRLARNGRVLEGEFRPGGRGREWCDATVLQTLRRRSLAALRREVEPAEPAALQRLLLDWQGVAAAPREGPDALLDAVESLQGYAIPASALESEVLPARLPGYRPADLDALCAAGEVVWVGISPLGDRDGRVALFLAEDLPLLFEPPAEVPRGELHDKIRAHLDRHGASFFPDLFAATGGLLREVLDALWDLVWSAQVVNDSPAALRAFLFSHARRDRGRRLRLRPFRSRREAPASAVGRWARLPAVKDATPTERLAARAEQLLARHGVVTRDAVAAESLPGGFVSVYPVLAALEDAGRIRRGYFVAGLGGSQFAHPGALERLRALREAPAESQAVVLAATDPANAYGAALPWPEGGSVRLARAAGAHVVLVDGALALYSSRNEAELRTFLPAEEPARSRVAGAAASALASWARRSGRTFFGETVADGLPLAKSALAPHLAAAGFAPAGGGFRVLA